jgi:hypothetical protein
MQVFEAAIFRVGDKNVTAVKVPDETLGDPFMTGTIMDRAEREFKSSVILVGADTGQMSGNLNLCRLLRDHHFDRQEAKWSQWNMEE